MLVVNFVLTNNSIIIMGIGNNILTVGYMAIYLYRAVAAGPADLALAGPIFSL